MSVAGCGRTKKEQGTDAVPLIQHSQTSLIIKQRGPTLRFNCGEDFRTEGSPKCIIFIILKIYKAKVG